MARRDRHAQMVHRLLGMKIGTGGSSGYHYLKAASSRHKVFTDFFDLSMYILPRSRLPKLPESLSYYLQFSYPSSGSPS